MRRRLLLRTVRRNWMRRNTTKKGKMRMLSKTTKARKKRKRRKKMPRDRTRGTKRRKTQKGRKRRRRKNWVKRMPRKFQHLSRRPLLNKKEKKKRKRTRKCQKMWRREAIVLPLARLALVVSTLARAIEGLASVHLKARGAARSPVCNPACQRRSRKRRWCRLMREAFLQRTKRKRNSWTKSMERRIRLWKSTKKRSTTTKNTTKKSLSTRRNSYSGQPTHRASSNTKMRSLKMSH
mmetsp:Transcript_142914/g.319622  ORF Transcript_142914/g.319622 Transcript_142914/m.319622 type:complete len:236 (-) Transcript_142914:5630-6337(-)